MKATAFITGNRAGSKAGLITTGLGALFFGGMRLARYGNIAKNPDQMIPVPGVSVNGVFNWLGGGNKDPKKRHAGNKAANLAGTALQTVQQVMDTPLEGFVKKGEGGLTHKLASTTNILDANAEEKVGRIMMKPAKAGSSLLTQIGKIFGFADKQFDMTGRIDTKIAKKKDEIASLEEALKTAANDPSRAARIKQGLTGKDAGYASEKDVQKLLKPAAKHIQAGIKEEGKFNNLSALERQGLMTARLKVDAKHQQKALDSVKHIKDKKERKAKLAEYTPKYNKKDLKIIKDSEPLLSADGAEEEILASLENGAKGKVSGKVKKTLRDYKNANQDLAELENNKSFWVDPVDGLKKKAKDVTLGEVADFTLRWGQVANEGYQQVKGAKVNLRALKQLMADVKGVDPRSISTWSILSGSGATTPMLKEARKQYIKSTFLNLVPFVGGAVGQEIATRKLQRHWGKNNPLVTIISTMGFQAVQSAGGFLTQGETMLQEFANMRMAEETGEPLTSQHYAQLLAAASSEIKKMGGVANYNTTLIAKYYEANNTSIADVMKDINKGKTALTERSQQGAAMVKQGQMASQALQETQAQQAPQELSGQASAAVEGKFSSDPRNQPKGGKGSFVDRALASQEAGGVMGLGGGDS